MAILAVPVSALEIEVTPQKYRVRPGELFPVDYTVSWVGDPGAYTVLPVTLPKLDWGVAELLEMRAQPRGDRQEVHLVVGYIADEPGDYETASLQIRVVEWGADRLDTVIALDAGVPTQVLDAGPVEVRVRRSRMGVWIVFLLVLVGIGGAAFYVYARKRAAGQALSEPTPLEQARRLLHDARKHRLDGDLYRYYRTLQQALDVVSPAADAPEPALIARIQARIDDTGYRGRRPGEDELEGDFKDVERFIERIAQRMVKES